MGSLGLTEGIVLAIAILLYAVAVGIPAAIICRRIGRSQWLGVLALIPVLNLGLLWFVAMSRWEVAEGDRRVA
jgi:multisubunit Na+/H+ antiporter MnhB subunit